MLIPITSLFKNYQKAEKGQAKGLPLLRFYGLMPRLCKYYIKEYRVNYYHLLIPEGVSVYATEFFHGRSTPTLASIP